MMAAIGHFSGIPVTRNPLVPPDTAYLLRRDYYDAMLHSFHKYGEPAFHIVTDPSPWHQLAHFLLGRTGKATIRTPNPDHKPMLFNRMVMS